MEVFDTYESVSGIIFIIIAIAALAKLVYDRIAKRRMTGIDSGFNKPLLNAYYTKNANITPLHNGMFGSLKYVLYMTDSKNTTTTGGRGIWGQRSKKVVATEEVIICCVDLPFRSSTHLVGLTKGGQSTLLLQDFIMQRGLERIELEGDFPSYAHIFAPPGNQVNARYLLDPSAMAYVADFCKTHHWEIVGSHLYFVSSDSIQGESVYDDPTPIMTEDIEQFVREIKPALTTTL